jgi:hypothetical protein
MHLFAHTKGQMRRRRSAGLDYQIPRDDNIEQDINHFTIPKPFLLQSDQRRNENGTDVATEERVDVVADT